MCFGQEQELATLEVHGAPTNPTSVTFYAEGNGPGGMGNMYLFRLYAPGSTTPLFFESLSGGEPVPQMSRVIAIDPVPTSIEGTWTLCAYINQGGGSVTISTWGLYVN
jgi:hypothetical protein